MTRLLLNRLHARGGTHRAVGMFVAAAVISTGCATTMNPSMQRVAVASDPPGARVFIGDEPVGVTPAHVELDRRDGDVALRFEKDCYQETVVPVPRSTSKRVLVNLLAAGVPINDYGLGSWLGAMAFWGVLGGITGRRSGAAFAFPDLVRASLEPMPDPARTEESGGGVELADVEPVPLTGRRRTLAASADNWRKETDMIHLFPKRIRVHGATRRAAGALAVAVVFSTGCATAINGRTQRVAVVSDPPGAQVFIADEPVGVTPASVELDRRDGDVALRFEKDCYRETVLSVPRRTSKRVLVNLLAAGVYINDYGLGSALGAMAFWGVLGGMLDRREGGAFTFPDLVRADLERLRATATSEESGGDPGIDDGCAPVASAGAGDHGTTLTEQ